MATVRKIHPLNTLALIAGGWVTLLGWIMLCAGLALGLGAGVPLAIYELSSFNNSVAQTQGQLDGVLETYSSVGDAPIQRLVFRYSLDGREFYGQSFTTQTTFKDGQSVPVEYLAHNPRVARIATTNLSRFGPSIILLAAIPCSIALIILVIMLPLAMRRIGLARKGVLVQARLVDQEYTNATVNDAPVIKYRFGYSGPDGRQYDTTVKTHLGDKLTDQAQEPVLMLPHKPAVALVLDSYPLPAIVNSDGELYFHRRFRWSSLWPTAGVLLSAAFISAALGWPWL